MSNAIDHMISDNEDEIRPLTVKGFIRKVQIILHVYFIIT